MEFNSWSKKIGEVKAYQPREQKFASFGNVNRFVNQDSGGTASGILNSNSGFAKQFMNSKKPEDSRSSFLRELDRQEAEEDAKIGPPPKIKKKGFGGFLSSIGGFFKRGFGF